MTAAIDRVMELLDDGKWHPLSELVDAVAPMLPPGPAYRRAEQSRRRLQESRGFPVTARQRGDKERAVASGRRLGARNVVRGLRIRGRVEERTSDRIEVRALPTAQVR